MRPPEFEWSELYPTVRPAFRALADDLFQAHRLGIVKSLFLPFQGYRSPVDQEHAFKRGVSKAHAFDSAHQFGLAVDFVAWDHESWSWAPYQDWNGLRRCAAGRNLINDIEWDRAHVEHPLFRKLKQVLRPEISGTLA